MTTPDTTPDTSPVAATVAPPAPKPARARKASAVATPAKPLKIKLVRDSFTMPELEYTQLEALKRRALGLAHHAKKSELLRAGVAALAAMEDAALLAALQAVPPLKTGRPKAEPEAPETPVAAAVDKPKSAKARPVKVAPKGAAKVAEVVKAVKVGKTRKAPAAEPIAVPAVQVKAKAKANVSAKDRVPKAAPVAAPAADAAVAVKKARRQSV